MNLRRCSLRGSASIDREPSARWPNSDLPWNHAITDPIIIIIDGDDDDDDSYDNEDDDDDDDDDHTWCYGITGSIDDSILIMPCYL